MADIKADASEDALNETELEELSPKISAGNADDSTGATDDVGLLNKDIEITWKQIIGGSVGNTLEWYDFSIYGFLANEISINFFPEQNKGIQLIYTFSVFAISYIVRPIGGILFGYIGDKYGRKISLQITMLLIFLSTFLCGVLPTYDRVGVLSPILLTLLRLIQGISVGGQLVGSMIFILESSNKNKQGYYSGIVYATKTFGTMVGAIVVSTVEVVLTEQNMDDWGWRVPFLFSFVIGIVGFIAQRNMEKSYEYMKSIQNNSAQTVSNPIQLSFKKYWCTIISLIFSNASWPVGKYIILIWYESLYFIYQYIRY